jgi:serine O-acetyltransferase
LIPHPNGIVISPDARIGVNCLIFHQVSIVAFAEIAGHVDIAAGAKILAAAQILWSSAMFRRAPQQSVSRRV